MNNMQLAIMVRDNAIHEWRTIAEISADEGVARDTIWSACEACLTEVDLADIRKFNRA